MHKRLVFSLFMTATLLISPLQNAKAIEKPSKMHPQLEQLSKKSNGTFEMLWNSDTNTPFKISGRLSQPSKHSPEWIAYEFLNNYKKLYGLRNPKQDTKAVSVERYNGKTFVKLQHLLFGIPVLEDWLTIEINNEGIIERIEGTVHPYLEKRLFNRPMHPAVSKKQAIKIAKQMIHDELVTELKVETYYMANRPGTPLIYAVTIQSRVQERPVTTLIHSLTGRIIEQN